MALARKDDLGDLAAEIERLQGRIDTMQRRRADTALVPVSEELSPLFPGGGLAPGSVYAVESSTSLLLALLSEASRAGSWCAVLGIPTLGTEAASAYGIALDRLALIPQPGERWMSVAAAVSEVMPLIVVRPPTRPRDAEVARLSARLRDRGSVLVIDGDWSGADVALRLNDPQWEGLGTGYGLLRSRTVTVTARGRRSAGTRRSRVQLPGPTGALFAPLQPALTPFPSFATGSDELALRRDERALASLGAS